MKTVKTMKTLFVAGVAALGLAACSSEGAEQEVTAETITITDATGEKEVALNPENVVVMDLGILDVLDYLDVDVVGVPQEANFPDYLAHYKSDDYQNGGGLKSADLEAIYEMDPDVIFINGRLSESYDDLVKIAPVVYLSIDETNYMESLESNMRTIGQIFEKEDAVDVAIDEINIHAAEVNEQVTELGLNALFTMVNEENVSAFGDTSRYGIIYDMLGFEPTDKSLIGSTHGTQVNIEYIVEINPDVLFVMDRQGAIGTDGTAASIFDNDLIAQTTAAKNDRIVFLDSNTWYLITGGITSTLNMIDEVANSIR